MSEKNDNLWGLPRGLAGELLQWLQWPPMSLAEIAGVDGMDLSSLQNLRADLTQRYLTTSDTLTLFRSQIVSLEASHSTTVADFNSIKMTWDLLNTDIYVLAKLTQLSIGSLIPEPQKPTEIDLASLKACSSEEVARILQEFYNDSVAKVQDLEKSLDLANGNETVQISDSYLSSEIKYFKWLSAELQSLQIWYEEAIQKVSDTASKEQETLDLLSQNNSVKTTRMEHLIWQMNIAHEKIMSVNECVKNWKYLYSKTKKELQFNANSQPEVNPQPVEISNNKTEFNNEAKEEQTFEDKLEYAIKMTSHSNSTLQQKIILKNQSVEASAVKTNWYKSLQSGYFYVQNDLHENRRHLRELYTADNQRCYSHVENILQQKIERIHCLNEKMVRIQKMLEEIYAFKRSIFKISVCEDKLTLKDAKKESEMQNEIDQLELAMLQQEDMKLSGDLNHRIRQYEKLMSEQNTLKKQQAQLLLKLNAIGNVSTVSVINKTHNTEKGLIELESDCEEVKSLKLQLLQQKRQTAEMMQDISMFKNAHNDKRSTEDIQKDIVQMQEEISKIKLDIDGMKSSPVALKIAQLQKKHVDVYHIHKDHCSEHIRNDERNSVLTDDFNKVSQALDYLQYQQPVLVQKLNEIETKNLTFLNELSTTAAEVGCSKHESKIRGDMLTPLKIAKSQIQESMSSGIVEAFKAALDKNMEIKLAAGEGKIETRLNMLLHEEMEVKEKQAVVVVSDLKTLLEETATMVQDQEKQQKQLEEEIEKLNKEIHRLEEDQRTDEKGELTKELEELKDTLKCKSCKVRGRDTFLLTCFHSFCQECIKKRYDLRQRKCPDCYGVFGFADIKRLEI